MELPGVRERIDKAIKSLQDKIGATPECPICANDDWSRTGFGRVVEIRTVRDEKPASETLYTVALGFTCTRCFFVRLHEVDPASWGMPGEGEW